MPKVFPELKSSSVIKRYEGNPILSNTVECLATANVNDLVKLCIDKK